MVVFKKNKYVRSLTWMGCACLAVALSAPAGAVSVVNLDVVPHTLSIDVGQPSEQQIVLQPSENWRSPYTLVKVKLPTGKHPDEISTLMDRDSWAIWKGGEFGVQQRRKVHGVAR